MDLDDIIGKFDALNLESNFVEPAGFEMPEIPSHSAFNDVISNFDTLNLESSIEPIVFDKPEVRLRQIPSYNVLDGASGFFTPITLENVAEALLPSMADGEIGTFDPVNLENNAKPASEVPKPPSYNTLDGEIGVFDHITLVNNGLPAPEVPKIPTYNTLDGKIGKFKLPKLEKNTKSASEEPKPSSFNTLDGEIGVFDHTNLENNAEPVFEVPYIPSYNTLDGKIGHFSELDLDGNANSGSDISKTSSFSALDIYLSTFGPQGRRGRVKREGFTIPKTVSYNALDGHIGRFDPNNLENNSKPHIPRAIDPSQLFTVLAPNILSEIPAARKLFIEGYAKNERGERGMQMTHLDQELREKLSNELYDDPTSAAKRFDAYNLVQQVAEMLECCEPVIIDCAPSQVINSDKTAIVKFDHFRGNEALANSKPVLVVNSERLFGESGGSVFYGEVAQCSRELFLKVKTTKKKTFAANTYYYVFVRPYENMFNAINQVTQMMHCDTSVISKVFGDRTFGLSKELYIEKRATDIEQNDPKITPYLNKAQKEAVYSILTQTPENPFLLFGPPGTGKTTTLVEALRCIVESNTPDQRRKFLICTPSNMAADNFALALLKSGAINSSKIIRILASRYELGMIEPGIRDIVSMRKDNPNIPDVPDSSVLRGFDVVISTIGSATKLLKLGKDHFTHVIIDEAGQATEPETLVPLFLMSGDGCRLILAGDPKQLGPVIVNEVLNKPIFRFDESLLMRLSEKEEYKIDPRLMIQLTDNHRSHETIVEIASQIIYDGTLVSTYPDGHDSFVEHEILKGSKLPVRFHAVFGEQKYHHSGSKYNLSEVNTVVQYVEELLKTTPNLSPSDIGVIAPYKEQGNRIKNFLARYKGITIDTVEKFQGSERRVIIMTTTRTRGLGFIDEIRRFNTAITRAQQLLIIVGNPCTLVESDFWKTFINFCASNGCFHADRKFQKRKWLQWFGEDLSDAENDAELEDEILYNEEMAKKSGSYATFRGTQYANPYKIYDNGLPDEDQSMYYIDKVLNGTAYNTEALDGSDNGGPNGNAKNGNPSVRYFSYYTAKDYYNGYNTDARDGGKYGGYKADVDDGKNSDRLNTAQDGLNDIDTQTSKSSSGKQKVKYNPFGYGESKTSETDIPTEIEIPDFKSKRNNAVSILQQFRDAATPTELNQKTPSPLPEEEPISVSSDDTISESYSNEYDSEEKHLTYFSGPPVGDPPLVDDADYVAAHPETNTPLEPRESVQPEYTGPSDANMYDFYYGDDDDDDDCLLTENDDGSLDGQESQQGESRQSESRQSDRASRQSNYQAPLSRQSTDSVRSESQSIINGLRKKQLPLDPRIASVNERHNDGPQRQTPQFSDYESRCETSASNDFNKTCEDYMR